MQQQAIPSTLEAVVIGGGPAGLMAAERLLQAGIAVHLFEQKRTLGRKFLLAGKGGLNLTHAEPAALFHQRYGQLDPSLAVALRCFGPEALRDWAEALGVSTFVGSSGRVFPTDLKAAPLLRRWLRRLKAQGLQVHSQVAWQGWQSDGALRLCCLQRNESFAVQAKVVVLACGGASWPQLGSDGSWVAPLAERVSISPLQPSNCGYAVAWSAHLAERFAGQALKDVRLRCADFDRQGELLLTAYGLEGSLLYAASAWVRHTRQIVLDLCPNLTHARLVQKLAKASRGKRSFSTYLQRALGLKPVKVALLREIVPDCANLPPAELAQALKQLPLRLGEPRPLAEAISTAGGVCFSSLNSGLMLRSSPGVFCCGEMLDWDAPTGGYLLTACFATGALAGEAASEWLRGTELTTLTTR